MLLATGPQSAVAADAIVSARGAAQPPAGPRGLDLVLELTLNGRPRGLVHFELRDGELWASADTLRGLGFTLPPGTAEAVRLHGLPGVQAAYNVRQQSVAISASSVALPLARTLIDTRDVSVPEASASPGLVLNYDLYGTRGEHGGTGLGAFAEARAFSGQSVLSGTFLTRGTREPNAGWQQRSTRLDTTWSRSFPDEILTLRIGDTTTSSLAWSRSTLIGGVQLSRNFALQPYRSTAPLASFLGTAVLPSQVEVFVNGVKQYTGRVPSGPFQLDTVPGITGAGSAQVVLTDAFGRATTLDYALYDVQQRMLETGLSDWSFEMGAVRRNYGLRSFDYGNDPAASGTWRHGLSKQLTIETHAEASRGLLTAGGGAVYRIGEQGGVATAAVARSRHGADSGSLFNFGYAWRSRRFNLSFDGTRTHGKYRDVASLSGAPAAERSGRISVGYGSEHLGGFGLSYIHLRYPAEQAARYVSATWSRSLGRRGSVNLSINHNLAEGRRSAVSLSFSWALDGNVSAGTSVQRGQDRTLYQASAQQSPQPEGGFGWRVAGQQGDRLAEGGSAEVAYLGRSGRVTAGVHAVGSSRYAYAGATGALALMGGHAFAARRLDNGFAVVSTEGIPGVPVKLENRLVGTTDDDGMLLVSPLQPYQRNQLAIDPLQLPADMRVDRVKAIATPTDRAGTLVEFGIRPVRAAALILVDEQGAFLPLGSRVSANGKAGAAIVGFDGMTYLDTLDNSNTLQVQTPAGRCTVRFDHVKRGHGIPEIGPLRCAKETSR